MTSLVRIRSSSNRTTCKQNGSDQNDVIHQHQTPAKKCNAACQTKCYRLAEPTFINVNDRQTWFTCGSGTVASSWSLEFVDAREDCCQHNARIVAAGVVLLVLDVGIELAEPRHDSGDERELVRPDCAQQAVGGLD